MERTVGQTARLANVSVRTLHHYDRVGLLHPSGRSDAGYRLYSTEDLERLQEVLLLRRLGLGLEAIRDLCDAGVSRRDALLRHQDMLLAQIGALQQLLGLVDRTLTTMEGGMTMSAEQLFEGLGDFDPTRYDEEVARRWGDSEPYLESQKRTRAYRRQEWESIRAEADANIAQMAALMTAGVPVDDVRAMDAAEAARGHIDRWFYPCSHEMHANVADLYVSDERFTAHYDRTAVGLAGYVRDAVVANGLRHVG